MAEPSTENENGQPQQLIDVPPRHIWRPSPNPSAGFGLIDLTVPYATDIPVIDFSLLTSSSSSDAIDAELHKLVSALTTWGCFQTVNHGIELSLLESVREHSQQFFHLPTEEKQKCARAEDDYEGYGNDIVLYHNQSIDWTDRLYLQVSPPSQRTLKYWPKNPPSLSDILSDYTDRVRRIQELLLKAMARSLSLPEDCFVKRFGEQPIIFARFNFYPPCARPDLVLGLKRHADGSGITILLQDKDVEGLQVLKDDQWFLVPTMPHALLVNVGDQIEIMSNGVFKSPVHRALTNSQRERNSLAMFYSPDAAVEIEPVEELVNDERPRAFNKVKNYVDTYFQDFQQGKRPIDAVRI